MFKARRAGLLYIAAAIFCLFFVSCSSGSSNNPSPTPSPGPSVTPPKKSDYILIPLGGNAWVRSNNTSDDSHISDAGIVNWTDETKIFDIYFRVNRTGTARLALELDAQNNCEIRVSALDKAVNLTITRGNDQFISIGDFTCNQTGYVKVTLEGISKSGTYFPSPIKNIGVNSNIAGSVYAYRGDLNYVDTDFGYGRRGPSDHLWYTLPSGRDFEWFYNEVTIEQGNDVIGSYYMANGFAQGYFGMQVNSTTERRILFSVWSPFNTNDPNAVPEDQRVLLLATGENVSAGVFGGEGTGGQSYLIYPWKAGITYKFLNRVYPTGNSRTTYTAYFFDPDREQWRLIASFSRPATNTWYTGHYSFLENFTRHTGQFTRRGYFGNQWARTKEGEWIELTSARFTADATARAGRRLDYQGGVVDNKFYLRNCGFFNETTTIDRVFDRQPNGTPPDINFSQLQ